MRLLVRRVLTCLRRLRGEVLPRLSRECERRVLRDGSGRRYCGIEIVMLGRLVYSRSQSVWLARYLAVNL